MVERRRHTATNRIQAEAANGHIPKSPPRSKARRIKQRTRSAISLGPWSSRALLLAVAAMYSTNFASVKYLETICLKPPCDHDPSEAAFCRFLVSAIVCLPILYSNSQHMSIIRAGFEVGFWFAINYVFQAEALEYIPAGKCAFISALSVVTVPIFAGIFLGKPIRRMSLVSAMVALVGVAILENLLPIGGVAAKVPVRNSAGSTLIFGLGKGDILALGQPVGFGYGVMRIDYYLEKFSHIPNRVLTLTAAQCVSVCLLSFLWVMYDCDEGLLPDLSYMLETHRLIALAWTGIVTTVLAIILQGIALQKASATEASLIFSTEPVWGSLFAGWLLNERLTQTTYIGGVFILAACVLGSLTDGAATDGNQKTRRHLKSKTSSLSSQDSLLPLRVDPQQQMLTIAASVESLTDVQKFPASTTASSFIPSISVGDPNRKIHTFI